jgi:hypothetical protein
MIKWESVGGKWWKCDQGYRIEKTWTIAVKKEIFFMLFMNHQDFEKGRNFKAVSSLREAKKYFKELS